MNEDPLRKDVINWIRSNAINIDSVDPDAELSDLQRLKAVLSGIDVVGLGEATHGTSEFFRLKHRLLRFLVTELGFTTLAFETPYPGEINACINGSDDALESAFRDQTFAVWQTEEVLETISWMRDFNRKRNEKIEFIGIDCQLNKSLVDRSISVLRKSKLSGSAIEELDVLFSRFFELLRLNSKENQYENFVVIGSSVIERLAFLESMINLGGLPDSINDQVIVLSQAVQLYMVQHEAKKYRKLRDRFMAENIARIASRGKKVVVWAHNGHVACSNSNSRVDMGWHLRNIFGKRYYAVAFTFFKGAFRSNFKSRTESSEYCIAMPPRENVEYLFHRSEIADFFLDLRTVEDQNIQRWWSLTHKAQGVGAIFKGGAAGLGTYAFSSQEYDGVIFIEHTSSSRPL